MEPQPQLQPIAPRPQLEFAEPTGRPLELKPGPRPLDLRPRPSTRPQLDIKYGPASPAEAAAQRANPLGNPLNVVKPVVNNPLGYAPGKGLVSAAAAIAQAATDPATFGVPATPLESLGLPSLPLGFPLDALEGGPVIGNAEPAEIPGGVITVAVLQGTILNGQGQAENWNSGPLNLAGYLPSLVAQENLAAPFQAQSGTYYLGILVSNAGASVGYFYSQVAFRGISASVSGFELGGQPYNPPTGEPQRAPNPARRPGLAPSPLPSSDNQPSSPFKAAPVPILFRPTPATPEMPRVDPLNPPAIDPDRPFLDPRQPFKFPPPITIPGFPSDDPTAPESPTKRPPPVRFPPVAPGTTGRELNPPKLPPIIPIFIPPLRRDDCATGDDLAREASRIRDLIEDILDKLLDDCKDLCGEAQLTRAFCEEINGELVPRQEFQTYDTLAPALGFLSREIAALKVIADPCGADVVENMPPAVLGSGSMIEGATVAYVDILPDVRQVELIITGQIPNSLRLYDSTLAGEQQAKFGAITLAYPGVTGGNAPDAFHQWAWTRRTSFYVGPPIRNDRRIRINLKSGLTWVLYDTGLRS